MKIGYCGTCDDPKPKRKGQITDKMRLDWLQSHKEDLFCQIFQGKPSWSLGYRYDSHNTPRQAIDSAIKSESKGGKDV